MCDFKPGDEVVCVDDAAQVAEVPLRKGRQYVIADVSAGGRTVTLVGELNGGLGWFGHKSRRFRKVHRPKTDLSIEAFLTIKPGFEEPKRVTEPKPKRQNA